MTAPLPSMPLQLGDPGVFVCSRRDLEPVRESVRAGAGVEQKRAPGAGVWLVLALCSHCNYRTGRYCSAHDARRRR